MCFIPRSLKPKLEERLIVFPGHFKSLQIWKQIKARNTGSKAKFMKVVSYENIQHIYQNVKIYLEPKSLEKKIYSLYYHLSGLK